MIVVERTFAVTAAPRAVLGYLADFANTQNWDPAIERTTRKDAGPAVPGASWHQVRKVFGVSAELTYTLITLEHDRLVLHGRNEGATCLNAAWVRPLGAGTEVTYRVELEMHGLAKLATPILKVEFEKIGTESTTRLTSALNALAVTPPIDLRSTEVRFDPSPIVPPTRGQEAQA